MEVIEKESGDWEAGQRVTPAVMNYVGSISADTSLPPLCGSNMHSDI